MNPTKALLVAAISVSAAFAAYPLTEADIDRHLSEAAQSKREPPFIAFAMKHPPGDFALGLFANASTPTYYFALRSCVQAVRSEARAAAADGREVDRAALVRDCAGRDEVRLMVFTNPEADRIASGAVGYQQMEGAPITALRLRVDGAILEPLPDEHADDFGLSRVYPAAALRSAKSVDALVTWGSAKVQEVPVPPKAIRKVLGE